MWEDISQVWVAPSGSSPEKKRPGRSKLFVFVFCGFTSCQLDDLDFAGMRPPTSWLLSLTEGQRLCREHSRSRAPDWDWCVFLQVLIHSHVWDSCCYYFNISWLKKNFSICEYVYLWVLFHYSILTNTDILLLHFTSSGRYALNLLLLLFALTLLTKTAYIITRTTCFYDGLVISFCTITEHHRQFLTWYGKQKMASMEFCAWSQIPILLLWMPSSFIIKMGVGWGEGEGRGGGCRERTRDSVADM